MTVEQRMEQLERQVRWARWVMVCGVLMAVAGMAMGLRAADGIHDVVSAKRFEVIGDNQMVIATLDQQMGHGGLAVFGPRGQLLARIGATTDGDGALEVFNGMGKKLVRLGEAGGGHGGAVTTYYGSGRRMIELASANVDEDGVHLDGVFMRSFDTSGEIKAFWPDTGTVGLLDHQP